MKVEKCPRCDFEPMIPRCSIWHGIKGISNKIINVRGYRLWMDKGHSMKRTFFFTKNGAIRYWNRWARREAKRIEKEGKGK